MDRWLQDLQADLQTRKGQSLKRSLRPVTQRGKWLDLNGRSLLNLAGNDYLGLSTHPRLIAAACEAARVHGVGAQASRLVSGHTPLHARVEAQFAAFKHAPAALLFPTGYMANLATLTALAGPGDLLCLDKLNHASLIDAAHASGARVRVYPHRETAKLARLLEEHFEGGEAPPGRSSRRLIVTDSVFSMDGDVADLPALCDLADRFDAILIVDEAHGTGVLGREGTGLAELQGVAERVDVVVSTASKGLGGLGGIVTARQEVIDTLVNRARPFIYTTAVPPAQAAAIGAAVEVIRNEPERRSRVLALAGRLRQSARRLKWLAAPIPEGEVVTPIVPLIVGTAEAALTLAAHLEAAGFYAPAIRPPTVPPGSARVRVTLRADLEDADLERLIEALSGV